MTIALQTADPADPLALATALVLELRARTDQASARLAADGLQRRAATALGYPNRLRSLSADILRIRRHLALNLPLPEAGGLRSLVRAARRSAQHVAARNIRERIADRGALSWPRPTGWPTAVSGYEVHHLGDSHALLRESAEMNNCAADFEEACREGHYRIASLLPRPGYSLPRCTSVVAHENGGAWVMFGVEAARHRGAPRDARDVTERLADLCLGLFPNSTRVG